MSKLQQIAKVLHRCGVGRALRSQLIDDNFRDDTNDDAIFLAGPMDIERRIAGRVVDELVSESHEVPMKKGPDGQQYLEWLNNVSNNTAYDIEACRDVYKKLGEISFAVGRSQARLEAINRMASQCCVPPSLIAEFLVKYIKTTK